MQPSAPLSSMVLGPDDCLLWGGGGVSAKGRPYPLVLSIYGVGGTTMADHAGQQRAVLAHTTATKGLLGLLAIYIQI